MLLCVNLAPNPSFDLNVQVNYGPASSDATITANINNVNALNPLAAKCHITVYPNPSSDIIYVKKPVNYTVEIYSVPGKRILSTSNQKINIRPRDTGIYFVFIQNESGESITSIKLLKIIKKVSTVPRMTSFETS